MNNVIKDPWNFTSGEISKLIDSLVTKHPPLVEITDRIFQGLKTGADKVFVVNKIKEEKDKTLIYSKENNENFWIETKALHPLLKSGNSKKYSIIPTDKVILFPYRVNNGKSELIPSEAFKSASPLAWKYLTLNKKILESREQGKMKGAFWYSYSRNQALDIVAYPRF